MKQANKIVCAVGGGMIALGLLLMLTGFAWSGFDPRVLSMKIDRGYVELGGVAVESPERIPGLDWIAELGKVEYGADASGKPGEPGTPGEPGEPGTPGKPGEPGASQTPADEAAKG